MSTDNSNHRKRIVLPYVAGTLLTLSLSLVGMVAPVFMEMYTDFGVEPLTFGLPILQSIHWGWTLPLGLVVSAMLIWNAYRATGKTNKHLSIFVIVLSVALPILFVLSAVTTTIRTSSLEGGAVFINEP